MGIYKDFAHFYKNGHYPDFSKRMFELLPGVLELFEARPKRVLDLACGEGTFAVALARAGYDVTGIDESERMLHYARGLARKEKVRVGFHQQDMRALSFIEEFDLVTCWFDSLNYLLELDDVYRTFSGVARALRPGGLFIFDVNTVYGLAVVWQREGCFVQTDRPKLLELLRPEYDYETNIATLRITGFRKTTDGWQRMDEQHRERGYTLEELAACVERAGLHKLACWGSFREKSEPQSDSGRVWFVVGK